MPLMPRDPNTPYIRLSRRHFLAGAASAPLIAPFTPAFAADATPPTDWSRPGSVDQAITHILSVVKPPVFPDKAFNIVKYGADPASQGKTSAAIKAAIDACNAAGGGRVVIPEGVWPTGPIHLKSGINLHLVKGATLKFANTPTDYLPLVLTRFEGTECMNYSPLIYAYGQDNIAITGEGTLDGQADAAHWWNWTGKRARPEDPKQTEANKRLQTMAETGVPVAERVFGEGSYLRPNFIQPYRCNNILIEGVRITASPMWEINPILSRNITVRKVVIDSLGPNNDGCDPESCQYVLIEDCQFNTGDDCIAIKSGRNADGRRINVPSEHILVRRCEMKDGHGGVSLGSEASGGIGHIIVDDCHMGSPRLERAMRLKSNSYRGGYIENVVMRNVRIDQVHSAVLQVDLFYGEGMGGRFHPKLGHIRLEGVTCQKSELALELLGYAQSVIGDVSLKDCAFDNVASGTHIQFARVTTDNVKLNGKVWTA